MAKKSENLSVGFLFDDTLDSNDGVAQQVKILGRWLSEHGQSVCYLVGQTKMKSWAGGKVHSLGRNLRVSFNKNQLSIPLSSSKAEIKKVLADQKLDILHVQMPHSPFLAQRVINLTDDSVTVIGTFHIMPSGRAAHYGSHGLKALYGRGLRRFDFISAVSQPSADFAKQVFGLECEVIPNTVDVSRFSSANKKPPLNKLVFLGRLVKRKGAQQLLDAFKLLHAKHPGVKLVIAGDGPERAKLEAFVQDSGLGGSVEFLGFIDEADKPALLASANIACFPSPYGESFGLVLIEAMAAGAEVVLGGNNPGYASVLGQQPQLLIDPFDTEEFARRLELLLSDKALAHKLHLWQDDQLNRYDVEKVGQQWLDTYAEVIAKRSKARHN